MGLSACSDNAGEGSALPPQLFLPELLIASATIPPSTAPIQFEQNLSRFSKQTFTYSFDGVEKSLNDYIEEAGVKHFLIVDDGEIVYEYRRFPISVTSRHQSWSMAKQVLSILIGIAIDEGFIQSIEDPMDQYEPLLSQNGFAGISFRQALQMSSSIRYDEQKDRFTLFFDIIEDRATFGTSGSTLIEKTTEDTLVADYPPDSQWQYTSINSQALAMALAAATGRSLKEYLWEKLWNPLGIPDKARMLSIPNRLNSRSAACMPAPAVMRPLDNCMQTAALFSVNSWSHPTGFACRPHRTILAPGAVNKVLNPKASTRITSGGLTIGGRLKAIVVILPRWVCMAKPSMSSPTKTLL